MDSTQYTSWEKQILKIITFFLPVVFLLPLITSSSYFFPFIVPRNTLFRIAVGLSLALFAMLVAARPKLHIYKKNKILLSYALFIIVLIISSLLNGDFLYSFWSTYERMDGLIALLFLFAFLTVLIGVYKTDKAWEHLFRFTVLISFFVAFIGWSQHVGADFLLASAGGERVSSTLGNSTYFAAFSMFQIFFAAYLIIKAKSEKLYLEFILLIALDAILIVSAGKTGIFQSLFEHITLVFFFFVPQLFILASQYVKKDTFKLYAVRGYFSIVILINFLALFNTQTRGALVGLIIGMFLILLGFVFLQKGKKVLKQASIGALIILVGGISSLFYFKDAEFIRGNKALSRVASISLTDNTAKTRFLNWEASFKGWKEQPILGWGEERYQIVFNKYFPQEIYRHTGSRVWFDRPHNVVVQNFVHGGLLGGLAYISIFLFAVFALYKYWRRTGDITTSLLFTGLLAAYTIQNLFVFDSINTSMLFILTLGFIIYKTEERDDNAIAEKLLVKKPPYLLFILLLLLVYSLTVPKAQANTAYIKNIVSLNENVRAGDITGEIIETMESTINTQYLGKFELRQNYADAVRGFLNTNTITNEQKLLLIQSAVSELKMSIESQEDNVRNYAFLSSLYIEASRYDGTYANDNIELVTKALELSPTRTHLYYAIGRSYLVVGNAEKAVESFAKGLELSPKVSDAHLNYLAALITVRDFEKAGLQIEEMKAALGRDLTSAEYARIAFMYQSVNQVSFSINILEEAREAHPEHLDNLGQLVTYYIETDQKNKAIELAEIMASLDPKLAAELDQFKKEILGNVDLEIE